MREKPYFNPDTQIAEMKGLLDVKESPMEIRFLENKTYRNRGTKRCRVKRMSIASVNLKVRFSDKPITGWGGLVVMSR